MAVHVEAENLVREAPFRAPIGGDMDFTFPDEFDTALDAAGLAAGARFEIRRFFWRDRKEITFAPPWSYFELTGFPAVGRYLEPAASDLVRQGEVRFYPAARGFQTRWWQVEQKSLLCRIDIPAITGMPLDLSDHQLSETIDLRSPHIRNLLRRAQQELATPGLCSQLVLDSISIALAAEMVQQFATNARPGPVRRRVLDQHYLCELASRVREEPGGMSVAELASEHGISPRHYERLFRAATGESPAAFCRRHVLALARDLLAERRYLVKEVAYRCGFASTASFSAAFRQIEGRSPQQYRDKLWRE
jgi:AraC family transcriptional regulator